MNYVAVLTENPQRTMKTWAEAIEQGWEGIIDSASAEIAKTKEKLDG